MADSLDSGSSVLYGRAGSSPASRTSSEISLTAPLPSPQAPRKAPQDGKFLRFQPRLASLDSRLIFYGGRRTRDEGRRTGDERRGTGDERRRTGDAPVTMDCPNIQKQHARWRRVFCFVGHPRNPHQFRQTIPGTSAPPMLPAGWFQGLLPSFEKHPPPPLNFLKKRLQSPALSSRINV